MLFRDEARIHVQAGDGGDGCVAFRREKYKPRGGPDGGDGGHGGSIVLVASKDCGTLAELGATVHFRAERGKAGEGKRRTGRSGKELTLEVPCGTLVYDEATELLLRDLTADGDRVVVAQGGQGGKGNARFARPDHQTPREATPGTPGEGRWIRLELKLIADVGLVGLPNAGKSTLLSRLSDATPKIADYPFTTLEPMLGVVHLPEYQRLVIADLPGLIEGAHVGVGLGHQFLKHVERTRVLLHLVDGAPPAGTPSPVEAYRMIRREIEQYSATLASKPEVLVASKQDVPEAAGGLAALRAETGAPVLAISAVTGVGLDDLVATLWRTLQATPAEAPAADDEL
ncbi:MAG: GTPase ObgE [Planctomycetota bacterium]|jgi:GTP-binding protein